MNLDYHYAVYDVQAWDGEERTSEVASVSYGAAREICWAFNLANLTGRMIAQNIDYCEVWPINGVQRRGRFADVTLVRN